MQVLDEDTLDHYLPILVEDVDADEAPADPNAAVIVTLTLTTPTGVPLNDIDQQLIVNPTVSGGIIMGTVVRKERRR